MGDIVMHKLRKSFGEKAVLRDVCGILESGRITGLMAPSGAGKTTLLRILMGLEQLDDGYIEGLNGLRLSAVFQEDRLCDQLDSVSNLRLVTPSLSRADARKALETVGLADCIGQPTRELSGGQRRRVAILRGLLADYDLLILDEPTSSLDEGEVAKLFSLMLDLKKRGVGIIFVTHFLDQVYEVCDRITVLRDGKLVGEYAIENLPRVELVSKMLGKELDDLADIKSSDGEAEGVGEVIYKAEGLTSVAARSPFNFEIHKGEVNGFTGLLGSGRSECVRAIFGADHVTGGSVKIEGKNVKISNPKNAMKHGIGYLPEDRKGDGIVGDLSVRENIILALQVMKGFFGPISKARAEEFADKYIKLLDIKTENADTPIKSLSGGNQQKVILARWLLTNPQYLILDEPTRGIDIGTKIEIQKLVLELAKEGRSVTFISSEIDEMLRTCSKLYVMRDGKPVGEITGDGLNQTNVMNTIAGGEK